VQFDVESLETVVTGGVAMLTIENGGQPVRPGQLFSIVSSPEADWFKQANEVDIAKADLLRGAVAVRVDWKQKGRDGLSKPRIVWRSDTKGLATRVRFCICRWRLTRLTKAGS